MRNASIKLSIERAESRYLPCTMLLNKSKQYSDVYNTEEVVNHFNPSKPIGKIEISSMRLIVT